MAASNSDLNGSAPDKSEVALLLIDVINDLDFPEGDHLLQQALPVLDPLAALKARCKKSGIPAIYVNDNFGRWRSDFRAQFERCLQPGVRGKSLVVRLPPQSDDYFVLKPRHSGFYETVLEILLEHLGVRRLILTGVAANICVLFTAHDAYLRGYDLWIPSDCVASNTLQDTQQALRQMKQILKADIRPSAAVNSISKVFPGLTA